MNEEETSENPDLKIDEENPEQQKTDLQEQDETHENNLNDLFGKPENYNFNSVEIPEGIVLDNETTSEFKKIAEQMNLSQKGVDTLMKLEIERAAKVQKSLPDLFAQYDNERQKAKIEEYRFALNSDKEIGGANLKQSLADANLAYDTFADDEVKDILQSSGLNLCPAVVKMFKRIGEQLKDDTIHGTGGDKKQRTASDWFPSMKDMTT